MGSAGLNNRSNGQQYLGVTELISLGGPSKFDVVETQELEKCLTDVGLYESQEETVSREEVLGRLDQIVKTWVKKVSRGKGFNEQLCQEANAKIFTFGSYRLGLSVLEGKGSYGNTSDVYSNGTRTSCGEEKATENRALFLPWRDFSWGGLSVDVTFG